VVEECDRLPAAAFTDLLAGGPEWVERLRRPARFTLDTLFTYPGKGVLVLYVESDGQRVRVSEQGDLLRYLDSQGLDPDLDPVVSKTVFHALNDIPGAGLGGGEVYMETTPDELSAGLAAFLQTIVEVIGLRHSKYKDALIKLSHESLRDQRPAWDS
jgi:hypothetical protein